MIHHVPKPTVFLKSLEKKLVPGGLILIQEINTSFFMRVILYLMRHEGYSYKRDVFDETNVAYDPSDTWSANCAITEMIFKKTIGYYGLKIIYKNMNNVKISFFMEKL